MEPILQYYNNHEILRKQIKPLVEEMIAWGNTPEGAGDEYIEMIAETGPKAEAVTMIFIVRTLGQLEDPKASVHSGDPIISGVGPWWLIMVRMESRCHATSCQ